MATNYIEIVTDGAVIEIDDGSSIVDVNSNSEITVEYSGDSKDANAIRGRTIETGTPADQEVLTWNNSASEWQYQTVDENVDDQVASLIQASSGNGITWTYDDSAGTLTPTLSIKNADVNASAAIAVSKLAASTVNYGGVTLTLGGSDTTPAFNLSDATSYVGDSSLVTTGAVDSGSITSGHGSIDIGSSALTAGTATFTQVDITAEGDLRLQDASGGQYVGFDAPSTVSTSYVVTMPNAVGSSGQALRTSDTGGTLEWFTPTTGDIEGITTASNSGLAGGATSGTPSLSLDMNNLTAASVNVANDSIAIIDADASNGTRKESIADLFAAVDGTGLTASSGVLSVDASQTQITAVGTIGTGTWQGSEIGLGYGGTELVGETDGKIVVADGSGAPVHLDIGSSTAITILGTVATGTWQGSSISTSYTDAKVTSVVAGTAVDVSGTTGDVTVNVDLSELATSTTDGDGDYFVVVDASDVSRKLTKGNISLAGFTGTAATATLASTVTVVDSSDTTAFPAFFDSATGSLAIKTDASGLTYNASSGVLSATFSGNITGNVTGNTSGSSGSCTGNSATATALETARTIGGTSFDGTANIVPGTITVADTTDTSSYVALFESATGSLAPKTDAAITYNAGTGVLSATFSGDLTGDVTGDVSGSSGSCTGNAATATVASTSVVVDSSDTTAFPAFFDSATGSLAIKTDASGLTYNASTGVLTSTFAGNLTGNVTGNTSGSSGSTTGNAATATALETARTIGGTSFDGTANIAVGLAAEATTLETARTIGGTSFDGSANIVPATITVADTSDTSCSVALFESATGDLAPKSDGGLTYNAGTGTLTATAFAGPLTGNVTGNASGSSGSCTGNAATATALATARTIGGVSFDGTGNITPNTFGASSFGDANITNVGDIALDTISSDAGTTVSVTLGTDAGDNFIVGNNNAFVVEGDTDFVGIGTDAPACLLYLTDANDGITAIGNARSRAGIWMNTKSGTGAGMAQGVTDDGYPIIQGMYTDDASARTLVLAPYGGGVALPSAGKLYLDGGSNTYLTESAADTISVYTEGAERYVLGGAGNPYIRLQAGNTGVGAIQYYEDDGGSGQVLHWQAGCRGADNNYYISENATIHSSYALMASGQDVTIGGALAKGSGSFKIDHPIKEDSLLVHSFLEGPRCDLLYRDSVELHMGTASVDMDEVVGLTDGTWEALCREPQVFVQNESGWSSVKGAISGSTLIISCEDTNSTDTVSWMVVAERHDDNIKGASWTDDDGRPILEPLKEA